MSSNISNCTFEYVHPGKIQIILLTLSALQIKTDIFANSVDTDETACGEPSHLDLYCLPFGV